LDSVAISEALWLPREGQLRALLGSAFRSLEVVAGGYRVTIAADRGMFSLTAETAEDAYASALLHVLDSLRSDLPDDVDS
jgi:hypothetical protein